MRCHCVLLTTWLATTPDGVALWTGAAWTGDPVVREKVAARLESDGPRITAVALCPSFPTEEPISEHALLAALIREYKGDFIAPGAPFDDVVPRSPEPAPGPAARWWSHARTSDTPCSPCVGHGYVGRRGGVAGTCPGGPRMPTGDDG